LLIIDLLALRCVNRCFLCAYTAGEALGSLETSYDDNSDCLTVLRRGSGELLLRAALTSRDVAERQRVESFFSSLPHRSQPSAATEGLPSDQLRCAVRLVESEIGLHHFGNTSVGFKSARRPDGDDSGSVVHIVNAETVRCLSAAAGLEDAAIGDCNDAANRERVEEGPLAPSRFRPNIVLKGLPAWSEFNWVGKHVRIGSVTFKVLSRTVRCEATNVDARAGCGRAVLDVPALLKLHFPDHGPYLGVYARVVDGGVLNVGDAVVGVVPDPLVRHTAGREQPFWYTLFLICAALAAILAMR
jgi:uncharacterized protein YcbX